MLSFYDGACALRRKCRIDRVVRLRDYLNQRGESARAFAARAGILERTVQRVAEDDGCHVETAAAIVRASRAEPTPDGDTVTLEDLVGAGA